MGMCFTRDVFNMMRKYRWISGSAMTIFQPNRWVDWWAQCIAQKTGLLVSEQLVAPGSTAWDLTMRVMRSDELKVMGSVDAASMCFMHDLFVPSADLHTDCLVAK